MLMGPLWLDGGCSVWLGMQLLQAVGPAPRMQCALGSVSELQVAKAMSLRCHWSWLCFWEVGE